MVWSYVINTNDHEISITKNNNIENDKIIVDISLSTTSKFNKTLSGRYVLNIGEKDNETLSTKVVDSDSNICILKIDNLFNESKSVNIEIDTSKYLFDINSLLIPVDYDSNNNIESVNTSISSNNSIDITVFKNNKDIICNISDFDININ